ncbi:ABC transporter permease subunit [Celerinatantimonas sp. YJH-8]|uniref:ABC transporter permease subunit n=1 Tax=Celerinatantimonas sp. YJH-8 TaxID=3228714 RepID=UPI0038C76F3E
MNQRSIWRTLWLIVGLLFLYLPLVYVILYSFNSSRLMTVWAGFSFKWYGALLHDDVLMGAVWMSLRVALMAATLAAIFGIMAAFVLARIGRFRGENGFALMITAPLVMPDVIMGLSLLLMFVFMGQWLGFPAQRGMLTILIAHVTLCTAYVTVIVSARLRELDRSVEEAALDLGATPLKVFFTITLPMMMPAVVSGWLLAFTLSLDDVVIASFVSGPSSTTLPMVIFSSVRLGISPKINALATLFILVVAVTAFMAWWLISRSEKRRSQALRQHGLKVI